MNHQTEDIDTCTYRNSKHLYSFKFDTAKAEKIFFIHDGRMKKEKEKALTFQQEKNYVDDLPIP